MDLNDILAKSRSVIKATSKDLPKRNNKQTSNLFEEKEMPDLLSDYTKKYASQIGSFHSDEDEFVLTENQLQKSVLPDSIKNAFLGDVVKNTPKQMVTPKKQLIKEDEMNNGVTFNLNETQIRTIVKDEMTRFLSKYFTKSLTEQIKKQLVK